MSVSCKFGFTKYPGIYQGTYWGIQKAEENSVDYARDKQLGIYDNRNNFVEEYDIREYMYMNVPAKVYESLEFKDYRFRDHIEIYKTNDGGYVVVISPYFSSKECAPLAKDGWLEINNMYGDGATTLVKVLDQEGIRKTRQRTRRRARSRAKPQKTKVKKPTNLGINTPIRKRVRSR